MTTTYRAGLIGCGRIGTLLDDEVFDRRVQDESWRTRPCTFAGNFVEHPRTQFVAAADPNERRLDRVQAKWGVESAYRDYHQMLAQESLDIVAVATRSTLHHPMVVAAAQAGVKAIFCEKPIADSLAEADEMIQVCEDQSVKLIVNHTFRFHPNLPRARDLIEEGTIGELRTIVCHFPHWFLHMGTHLFDLMGYFAGEPASVCGRLHGNPEEDTGGTGIIRFQSGVQALVDARSKANFGYLELMGQTGILRFGNDLNATFELWLPEDTPAPHDRARLIAAEFPGVPPEEERRGPGRGRFVCATAIDEVVACLDEDRQSFAGGREARQALEIAIGIYQSHSLGGITIDLPNEERSLSVPEAVPPTVLEAQSIL